VTQSITLLGQGFHPLDTGAGVVTLHPTQRALPSGHPTGAAALYPAQRFHLWTLTRRSPLWTWRKGLAALCTPAFFGSLLTSEKEPLTGTLPAHPVNGFLLWLWAKSRKTG